jgi:hypothetical protein
MKKTALKILWGCLIILLIAAAGFAYLNLRPVKVIAVHHDKYSISVLVNRMPFSATEKIKWWIKNQPELTATYKLPGVSDTYFNIYFWAFGDGYKELGKYDRLCFQDMPPPKNCIEKERLMYITLTRHGEVDYWLNNTRYIQKKNGELYEKGFD